MDTLFAIQIRSKHDDYSDDDYRANDWAVSFK